MQLTQEQLKIFIAEQVQKMLLAEGIDIDKIKKIQSLKLDSPTEVKEEAILVVNENIKIEEEFETIVPNNESTTSFVNIEPDESIVKDVKKLNEEFKRMKELVDFRSPLFKRD